MDMPARATLRKPVHPPVAPDRLRGVRLVCIEAVSRIWAETGVDADMDAMLSQADEFYHWVVHPELPGQTQYTPRLNTE